ncbi:MAG: RnfABCDGE type electron transport complex subunit [Clostridiales bacterium]|jgi:electron transport complex protein RnfG|nr:RnfABCDGE type electron transport complex subunit [Clostridiales bacterium]
MKDIIKNALILCVITLIAAFMLSFVNSITSEVIIKQEIAKQEGAFKQILSNADSFDVVELDEENSFGVTNAYVGLKGTEEVGYLYNITGSGYGGEIKIIIGINVDSTIAGISILSHTETANVGSKIVEDDFTSQFKDKQATEFEVVKTATSEPNEIQAISGATVSSKAVTVAINNAIEYYNEVVGGLD